MTFSAEDQTGNYGDNGGGTSSRNIDPTSGNIFGSTNTLTNTGAATDTTGGTSTGTTGGTTVGPIGNTLGSATAPAGLATLDQVLNAYKTTPGAISNPDQSALDYWMKAGLGGFKGSVDQVNYNHAYRPPAGTAQTYQDIYRPQYQNYNTGNSMGVSQYGQQQPFGMSSQSAMQAQNPYMSQQPVSSFNGQMMGGGYGQFGSNNAFNPYTNSYLNMPQNFGQMGQLGQADQYNQSRAQGFSDQSIRSAATGLAGPQSNSSWQGMQQLGYNMMNPAANSASPQFIGPQAQGAGTQQQQQGQQQYMNPYMGSTQQQMYPSQQQSPFGMQQQNFSGQQFQNPFATQQQSPMQYMGGGVNPNSMGSTAGSLPPQRQSSGPQQPIYSRSAGMRGTPAQRMYAEGGITALLESK